MKKFLYTLMLLPLMLFGEDPAAEKECCDEADKIDFSEEGGSDGYDPRKRYYPYGSIYQDSVIRDDENREDPSWAGKRTDKFADELMR